MPSTLEATVTRGSGQGQVDPATRVVKSPGKAFTLARKTLVLVRGPYTPSGDEAFVKLFHKRRYKFSHKTKRGKRGDELESKTIANARGRHELIEDLAPMIQLLHCPSRNKESDMKPWMQPEHAPAVSADDSGTIKQYAVEIIAAIVVLAYRFAIALAHEGTYESMDKDKDKATAAHKAVVDALHAQDAFDAREVAEEQLSVTIGPENKK
ncbi:hypothetical protein H9P43_008388 [Blastocladiella emersonii ATCC 22665]|nr:hypothetical protein H9P43_008388 [Blastocladiella emersonii ATCC 22665]